MDFRKLVQQAAEFGYQSVAGGFERAGQGVGYVMQMVGGLRLFGSTQSLSADQAFDERHYFLVPDPRCEDGYSLVVTRCLPEGVPPINDLPKRRILHLPHPESKRCCARCSYAKRKAKNFLNRRRASPWRIERKK